MMKREILGHKHQDEGIQDVALVVPVLSQVVIAAGHQQALYR